MPSKSCDGKRCGTGKYLGMGKYLCKHNNIAAKSPHLVEEWHPDNPGRPEDYFYGSGMKAKWKCSNDPCGCHVWEARIRNRTTAKTGCPFCSGRRACLHTNLAVKYPDLVKEWHPDNPNGPEEFTPCSNTVVLWKCRNDPCGCHVWKTKISNRTSGKTDCPFCNRHKACPHDNLALERPDLAKEWHPDNPKGPEEYSYGSKISVWWLCPNGHAWKTKIHNRTGVTGNRKCPYCHE